MNQLGLGEGPSHLVERRRPVLQNRVVPPRPNGLFGGFHGSVWQGFLNGPSSQGERGTP